MTQLHAVENDDQAHEAKERLVRRALYEAHFLIAYDFQSFTIQEPEMINGEAQWRVWHLDPKARELMNASQQNLYDALIKLKPQQ